MTRDQIYIIGGGTFFHVRPHLALAAPAFGTTAFDLMTAIVHNTRFEGEIHTYTTRMAGDFHDAIQVRRRNTWTGRMSSAEGAVNPHPDDPITNPVEFAEDDPRRDDDYAPKIETNEDVLKLVNEIVANPRAKILFLPAALCDFEVDQITDNSPHSGDGVYGGKRGKEGDRLVSGRTYHLNNKEWPLKYELQLKTSEKIIKGIRANRKDLFLVGFKTTTGATPDEQFKAGLRLLKTSSCNLVLANDLHTRHNMIITPEQARYGNTTDREEVLTLLVKMAVSRSEGTFTRSSVLENSETVPWNSDQIPSTLRTVVEHCIKRGAYRPFLGKTVGHFAARLGSWELYGPSGGLFLTSLRGTNFNRIDEFGMAKAMIVGEDKISVLGGKPSVGGMSQRIIFTEHPDMDCIVHFHCPLKEESTVSVREQWPYECGSHECGKNTSDGLTPHRPPQRMADDSNDPLEIKAVMLDKHGPNIVFNSKIDPQKVIDFIESNFDLTRQTSELA